MKASNITVQLDTLKSSDSERYIFLSDTMMQIMKHHLTQLEYERKIYGKKYERNIVNEDNEKDMLICCSKYGTLVDVSSYGNTFTDFANEIGLNNKTAHNMRATYATVVDNALVACDENEGTKLVDSKLVSYLLGHKVNKTILDYYSKNNFRRTQSIFIKQIQPLFDKLQAIALEELQARDPYGTQPYKGTRINPMR
jgi:integrase